MFRNELKDENSTFLSTEGSEHCFKHIVKEELSSVLPKPTEPSNLDDESVESMPSSESLLYDTRSKLMSSDHLSMINISPIAFSAASSTTSLPSVESFNPAHKVPLAADISASLLTSSNNQTISIKDMEESPELMVVMARLEAGLLSCCKRISMMLQEAIRLREEATLSNEVDTRSFNDSSSMAELRECEAIRKSQLLEIEDWYESQVSMVEESFAEHLDRCEKELEDYRSECFAKAEKKETELDKELKNDPPERASRIRSQVLERYHNKMIEGEHDIQVRRRDIKQKIHQSVKEIEREYQRRRRAIEKDFSRESNGLKQDLLDRKRAIQNICNERRDKARTAHSTAVESSRDILRETLNQVKDLLRSYEEAYVDSFSLSGIYLVTGVMNQMMATIIKKLHLFCDIRVHEQVKKMIAVKNEIDAFQENCENLLRSVRPKEAEEEEEFEEDSVRGDLFLKSSIKLQSELIGRVLLEIEDNTAGFHGRITTLREQFAAEVNNTNETSSRSWLRRKEKKKVIDEMGLKKKYLGQMITCAQEELEVEYKRCVLDIVDFASNSARLFYREMAFRYWLLLKGYKEHHGEESIYDTLTAVNQEVLTILAHGNAYKTKERPTGFVVHVSSEGDSVKQVQYKCFLTNKKCK